MEQPRDPDNASAAPSGLCILRPARAGAVLEFAAQELAGGLSAMIGETVPIEPSAKVRGARIALTFGHFDEQASTSPDAGGYTIAPHRGAIVMSGSDERAVLDATYRLMRELGARYPLGRRAQFPQIDRTVLSAIGPIAVQPAFTRRCLVSDIMTWHYADPERLSLHLEHDREFIPWMARAGINAFSYIRHAIDTRYRIEEIDGLYRERGIDVEYGGHIIQQLLPRECFADHPEYFPAGAGGVRMVMGNLCTSNSGALAMVRDGALDYLGRHPDTRLLHVWGADVWKGAWCACDQCREVAPQLQYLKLVNAIATAGADSAGAGAQPPAVAYLAYHDTIDPAPDLRPLDNVWFEWAPRERCYSHAIDNPDCAVNPRYFNSLKRYIESFEGRGHIFEYYADAILFGGIGFSMPSVIAQDLRAYRDLGIKSVSCLTFGAFSVFAYPVNLAAFAELANDPDADPEAILADTAVQRHPACGSEMARAYRAVRDATALTLSYGEVLRPFMPPAEAKAKRVELRAAAAQLRIAIGVATDALERGPDRLLQAERMLWSYGVETLMGMDEYLAGREEGQPRTRAQAALAAIRAALTRLREIQSDLKGTWGIFDLEDHHSIWMERLRARLDTPKT